MNLKFCFIAFLKLNLRCFFNIELEFRIKYVLELNIRLFFYTLKKNYVYSFKNFSYKNGKLNFNKVKILNFLEYIIKKINIRIID